VQVIRFFVLLIVSIINYDDVVDIMICFFVIFISTCDIDWFFLSVKDSGSNHGVDDYGFCVFDIAYVTYYWCIMMLILIVDMFH
jgi:hypothetical protein